MANKNFEVKHGLSVGGTERISSAGVGTFTDLNVTGTTTTLDTTTLQVKDKNIVLNYGSGDTSSTANGAGITIQNGVDASADATINWSQTAGAFEFSHPISTSGVTSSGSISGTTGSYSGLVHVSTNDSTTNAAVESLRITNLSTGTTTTGFGGEIRFQAERNNGVNQNTGSIKSVAEVNSGSDISSGLVFGTGTAGVVAEAGRFTYTGDFLVGTDTNLNVLSGTPKIQVGDGSGHSSMQFYSGTGSVGALYFGDGSSGTGRYPGYIEYRHNNDSMAFQVSDANSLILREDRLDVCTGVTEARITINGTGTPGTNNSNWIRGSSNTLMYNSAGAYHAWEIGGTENMRLHHDPSASQGHLTLSDNYPWIDQVAPDAAYFKAGLTARGGASSTQGQFHLHITRDSGFRKLSTAANYDTYLVTETANTAYGNLRIGVDQTECIFIDAGTKGVAIVGGPTNNASSTYQVNSVFEVNGSGSQDCPSDGKLTVTKNASGDWSVQTVAGSDDYGYKTIGNGGYAYAVYNQPASAYRMRCNYNGELYLNGGSSALFNINSDARLKEDITDCPSQWDLIKGLPLQRFHWKDRREGDKWSYGFIAQEVEKTNPEFVQTVQDAMADTGSVQGDYKTVAEGQIHERALAALQEAMARIETLEAEVTALKG